MSGKKCFSTTPRLWLYPSELRSCWIGPFIVAKVYPHGAVEIQSIQTNKIFKVNEHRLKPYYENMPVEEIHEVELAKLTYTEE